MGLLATITPGVRAELAPFPGGLATNLYLLLVGGSTRSRKSTSQRIGADLLDVVLPNAVLPARMTGEGAIHTLAGRSHQSSVWLPDEFGVTLGQIVSRDFMKPWEELLLSLYGDGNYTYHTVKEVVSIRSAHLNVIGATTPEALGMAGAGAVLSGLLPRFGVVFPEYLPPARPIDQKPDLTNERNELMLHLREVQRLTQTPQGKRSVRYSKAAVDLLSASEGILEGYVGTARLPVMTYKLAMLSALADLRAEVGPDDADQAIAAVRRWAGGSQRLDPYLRRRAVDLEFDRLMERVRATLRLQGGSAQRGKVSR